MSRPLAAAAVFFAGLFCSPYALAAHRADGSDYPGSWAIADGHGHVTVHVVHLAAETCWRIREAREGVPDRRADQPTDRYLYVTLRLERTALPCVPVNTPLQTNLILADRPGKISIDIFVLDNRGVLQRSQRHRIDRSCGASTSGEC
jgi:hypothetical protein